MLKSSWVVGEQKVGKKRCLLGKIAFKQIGTELWNIFYLIVGENYKN